MATYGTRLLTIKLGRKSYTIPAIITDVKNPIIGMDLINLYKLGFDWIDDELYIIDKKASIKQKLAFVTIPSNSLPNSVASTFSKAQNDSNVTLFEIACINKLGEQLKKEDLKNENEEELFKNVPEKYRKLIKKYDILNPNYKAEPKHNIVHRIETSGQPCKSKVRPLHADKIKEVKRLFEEMENSGVITKVGANSNTNWSSALHVVVQNGQIRICGDYRLLNKQIINDSYPLPLIRNISQNLHGSTIFTKIDLKKAYWNLPIFGPHKHKTTLLSCKNSV